MPSLTNRLKLALPNGNEYVNRAALNKIFEDIDRLVMLQGDFDTAKIEIDDNLSKKVSKSGDTMTGELSMQANMKFQGDTERNLAFRTLTDNREFAKMYANPDKNRVGLYSTKNAKNVWEYDGSTDSFNVNSPTNLVKKAEIYSHWMLPTGTPKPIPNNDDLNLYTESGIWQSNNAVNLPLSGIWHVIEVIRHTPTYVIQRATVFADNKEGNTYVRAFRNTAWSPWRRVSFMDEVIAKNGDIITGSMTMDVTTGQKRFVWAGNNINTGFNASDDPTSQNFSMVDYKNNRTIWTYEPLTNSFNFRGDMIVPWIKKTGDTITGHMAVDVQSGEKVLRAFLGGTNYGAGIAFNSTGMNLYDWSSNSNILDWNSATKTLTLANGVVNTNLMKKTGDTATGEMTFRHNIQQQSSDGKTGIVSVINLSQTKWAVGPRVEGTVDWSKELSMSLITGEVSVAALKVKGERALTISDAEEKTPSRSGKDENGIYVTYEETQEDGKLWKRSVLSSPDADGNYLVRTVTYYKDGVAYKTKTFDLKYDEDGDFVKAVPR